MAVALGVAGNPVASVIRDAWPRRIAPFAAVAQPVSRPFAQELIAAAQALTDLGAVGLCGLRLAVIIVEVIDLEDAAGRADLVEDRGFDMG